MEIGRRATDREIDAQTVYNAAVNMGASHADAAKLLEIIMDIEEEENHDNLDQN